jgi:hypothetical protein
MASIDLCSSEDDEVAPQRPSTREASDDDAIVVLTDEEEADEPRAAEEQEHDPHSPASAASTTVAAGGAAAGHRIHSAPAANAAAPRSAELRFASAHASALGHNDIPEKIALDADRRYTVGREEGENDDFIYLDSTALPGMVSRRHATIWFSKDEGDWIVNDLGSLHGLLLNGIKVGHAALKEGVCACGSVSL